MTDKIPNYTCNRWRRVFKHYLRLVKTSFLHERSWKLPCNNRHLPSYIWFYTSSRQTGWIPNLLRNRFWHQHRYVNKDCEPRSPCVFAFIGSFCHVSNTDIIITSTTTTTIYVVLSNRVGVPVDKAPKSGTVCFHLWAMSAIRPLMFANRAM